MSFPQNELMSEALAFPVPIGVNATLTTATVTGPVDLQKARKVIFVVSAGTLGASAVVTCKLQGCATSGGSYVDIPSSTVTLVKATDDNKFVTLEITADYLNNLALGYRYVQLSTGSTVSSAVYTFAVAGTGPNEPVSRYLPNSGLKAGASLSLV